MTNELRGTMELRGEGEGCIQRFGGGNVRE